MNARHESARLHYVSAHLLLAYGWAYLFTVFATLVGLDATRLGLSALTWPAVILGYAALFAVIVGLRPILVELAEDLGLREKAGIFILCVVIFFTPKLVWPRATLVDCLIVIQLPLAAFLVKRESFLRLYAANFLLVALGAFVEWQMEEGGFEWVVALVVLLAGCFAADRFFLELDRYPSLPGPSALRPLLLGLQYAAAALAGGAALYLVTPQLALVPREHAAEAVVGRPGGVRAVTLQTLWELTWQTVLVMVVLVLALAVLQWLKRKYRRSEGEKEVSMGAGVMKMVRKIIRPAPRAPEWRRGFSPREQILRGYWSWCDELERFGLARPPEATPKEFAGAVARREGNVAAPVRELTRLFEWAKYDQRELTRNDVEEFFNHSRDVIETLLAAAKLR